MGRMRARLAEGGDVARGVLAELFPQWIWLEDTTATSSTRCSRTG
jgi:hypothetical protein